MVKLMADDVEYRELVYLEGTPHPFKPLYPWDFILRHPVNRFVLHDRGGRRYEYVRTTRTWKSPITNDTHIIFCFDRGVWDVLS